MSAVIYKRQDNPVFCDALVRPLSTEKTVRSQEFGVYAFLVARWADKNLISKAIEALYNVKVERVNILNSSGKTKVFRGRLGSRQDTRKAYVKLVSGQRIELA